MFPTKYYGKEVSILEVSRGHHSANFQWCVARSDAENFGGGAWLISPLVLFAGWQWWLDLLMEGSSSGRLSLCLHRCPCWSPAPAPVVRYRLGARMKDEGPEEEEEEISRGTMEDDCPYVSHPWLLFPELLSRMERSEPSSGTLFSIFLRLWTGPETDDEMTRADFDRPLPVKNIQDVKPSSDRCEQGSASLSSNQDSLSGDLEKLLADGVFSDVNLKCGDQTKPAHKNILAARSPVFSAMFQSRMTESETGVVDIVDVDVRILEMFLKYVYSGRLTDVPDELLPGLYAVGDKYAVSPLKTACSERMISNLTRENCLSVLILADAHSDQDLQKAVYDFILNHVEILKSQEWTEFSKENPYLSNEVLQFVVERQIETKPKRIKR